MQMNIERIALETWREIHGFDAVQQVANRSDGIAGWHLNGNIASWNSILPEVEQALALPQDTSALEAVVQRAGEVMRERCCKEIWYDMEPKQIVGVINSLPNVTLEDLKCN